MSNEASKEHDGASDNGLPRPTTPRQGDEHDAEVRRISEHVRRVQLESEARILARWRKRGLFGLTTSTG